MYSLRENGEGKLRGHPANAGSPRRRPLNRRKYVILNYACAVPGWLPASVSVPSLVWSNNLCQDYSHKMLGINFSDRREFINGLCNLQPLLASEVSGVEQPKRKRHQSPTD